MSARHGGRAVYAGLSDTGLSRSHNEDAFIAEPPLFAVADGLGGHQAGEVASGIAIDTLAARAPVDLDAPGLADAVRAANTAIMDAVANGVGREGMGTTMTAAIVQGTRAVVAHVGDSRAYLLQGERLTRVSRDHSLVGEMIRAGTLSEEDARHHPQRSVITRALGSRDDVTVDTYDVSAEPGDRLLLCSDGLHGMLLDDEIESILGGAPDAEDAARGLVEAANDAGGLDNVTAVVVEFGDRPTRREASGGRRVIAALVWMIAALALIGATAWGVRAYATDRAFLIAEDGRVVVYRGVQGNIAGIALSEPLQTTDVRIEALPEHTAERLTEGVAAGSVDDAFALVEEYRALASETETSTGP